MTKRHRKKWADALSLVLPVLLFFAVLNCFTAYLYYVDSACHSADKSGCLVGETTPPSRTFSPTFTD